MVKIKQDVASCVTDNVNNNPIISYVYYLYNPRMRTSAAIEKSNKGCLIHRMANAFFYPVIQVAALRAPKLLTRRRPLDPMGK